MTMSKSGIANHIDIELLNQKIIKQTIIVIKLNVIFCDSVDIFYLYQQDNVFNRFKYSQYFTKREFYQCFFS